MQRAKIILEKEIELIYLTSPDKKENFIVTGYFYSLNSAEKICGQQEYEIIPFGEFDKKVYIDGNIVGVKTRKVVVISSGQILSYEVLLGNKKIWKYNEY